MDHSVVIAIFVALALKRLVQEAINKSAEALAVLAELPWMRNLIDEVAALAAQQYRREKEEISSVLWVAVLTKISTLRSPEKIKGWLYTIAKNFCLKEGRKARVERIYAEKVMRPSQMVSSPQGGPTLHSCSMPTFEQALSKEEELREEKGAKNVRRVSKRFPPALEPPPTIEQILVDNDRRKEDHDRLLKVTSRFPDAIVNGWRAGKTSTEVAKEMKVSVETASRRRRDLIKAIVEEFPEKVKKAPGQD